MSCNTSTCKGYYKYRKDFNKEKESSYLMYCDANNIYRWVMPQNLLVDNFQ